MENVSDSRVNLTKIQKYLRYKLRIKKFFSVSRINLFQFLHNNSISPINSDNILNRDSIFVISKPLNFIESVRFVV